jgi:hypothetical protein
VRFSLRLILFLVIGITLVTFFISRNEVRAEKRGLRVDLERRAAILAESLQEIIEPAIEHDSRVQLRRIVERFENQQQLAGVIVYDADGNLLAESSSLANQFTPPPVPLDRAKKDVSYLRNSKGKAVLVALNMSASPRKAAFNLADKGFPSAILKSLMATPKSTAKGSEVTLEPFGVLIADVGK